MDNYVTVLVLTYNQANLIVETLDSINNQTYPFLDLVVNDDASIDDTVECVKKWVKEHSGRFRNTTINVAEVNQGISKSANVGMNLCRTEWVQLLAGDDLLLPDSVALNLGFTREHGIQSIVLSYVRYFRDEVGIRQFWEMPQDTHDYIDSLDGKSAKEQYKSLLKGDVKSSAWFMNKGMFDDIGGFDEKIKNLEDWPMRLRITSCGYTLHFQKTCTLLQRRGIDTISSTKSGILNIKHVNNVRIMKRNLVYPYVSYLDFSYWMKECVLRIKEWIYVHCFDNDMQKLSDFKSFFRTTS